MDGERKAIATPLGFMAARYVRWLCLFALAVLILECAVFARLTDIAQFDLDAELVTAIHASFRYLNFFAVGFAAAVLVATRGFSRTTESPGFFVLNLRAFTWLGAHALCVAAFLLGAAHIDPNDGVVSILVNTTLRTSAVITLALAIAPARYWIQVIWTARRLLVGASLAGALLAGFAFIAYSTPILLDMTLHLVAALLRLGYSDVVIDPSTRLLGVGDFYVTVAGSCSGVAGIGLMSVACLTYLYFFRASLRFPSAWLLLPIGVTIVWLLNAVRIAVLVWIGDSVSPTLALTGFHSYAGWLMFLVASSTVILLTEAFGLFAKPAESATAMVSTAAPSASADSGRADWATAMLSPFAAIMAATLVSQTFALNDSLSYALKVIGVLVLLFVLRTQYRPLARAPAWSALIVGLVVAAVWLLTVPRSGADTQWVAELPRDQFLIWAALKFCGFALIVPIAEELAFRGYLTRLVENAAPGAASLWRRAASLLLTSVLFGALHQRWLSAAIAGACYWLVFNRRGRIADAIGAHAITNAAIFATAAATDDWALL